MTARVDPSREWIEHAGIDYDELTAAMETVFGDRRPNARKPGDDTYVASLQIDNAMALMRALDWPDDDVSKVITRAYKMGGW